MPRLRGVPVPYLFAVRQQKGLTQKELAAKMKPPGGITAISTAENGGLARRDTIKRWARALGVSVEELITAPEERSPPKNPRRSQHP